MFSVPKIKMCATLHSKWPWTISFLLLITVDAGSQTPETTYMGKSIREIRGYVISTVLQPLITRLFLRLHLAVVNHGVVCWVAYSPLSLPLLSRWSGSEGTGWTFKASCPAAGRSFTSGERAAVWHSQLWILVTGCWWSPPAFRETPRWGIYSQRCRNRSSGVHPPSEKKTERCERSLYFQVNHNCRVRQG